MTKFFKNNFWLFFGGIFATIATVFGLVAGSVWWRTEKLIRDGVRSAGTVVELVNNGKNSYTPIVEFELPSGEMQRYVSNMSSSPPSYDVGETVRLWYDPADPSRVVLAGIDRWLLPAIFGGIFVIFGAIGYGTLFYRFMVGRRKKWLLANGRPIEASFVVVDLKTNVKMNGQSPFVLRAQWHDPAGNKVYTYESEYLWYDPSDYVSEQKPISVLIDPQNPASYHMDISFLPEAGN